MKGYLDIMENTEQLLKVIDDLDKAFNISDVHDYRILINLIYNNITILHEENEEINNALAKLIADVYHWIDDTEQIPYDGMEFFFTKKIRQWFEMKEAPREI